MAFYRVQCKTCGIGDEIIKDDFTLGTYLVKHDYNPEEQTKAKPEDRDKITCFKFALFYEYASKYTYQAKFSYITNFAKDTLRPLKRSFASFTLPSFIYLAITSDTWET